ncbi:MAG TPA: divalent-cation tolerance protein CutA [Candidatus Limnocylindria bacterium]|jgi:periplasmic divalent cation tolerance protein|nr:divalent-cation tolerance protein CutA [Candidatus Limnocylindria bacterium]
MKQTSRHVLVLVTAPDLKTARGLAKVALEARLVACANLVPRVESHYWWQGKLERSTEVLMLMKTTRPHLKALETTILTRHPYDTAEFVVLPLGAGSAKYLAWIDGSVAKRVSG